jgi:type IV fimbrial biogenesis protein FimT
VTEVVMVMTIMGILVGIGLPSFKYVTTSNRISSEINGLLGDMQFARSQAIKQGQTVTICASSDGATCSGANTWQLGWIVFLDAFNDHTVDPGDAVIRVQPKFNSNDTLVASVPTFTYAQFNRMGYAPTGVPGTFTINLHDSTATSAWTRCLAITPAGSVNTEPYGVGTPPCN